MIDLTFVRAGDAAGIDAFRAMLVQYNTELPDDLRIPEPEEEQRTLAQKFALGALLLARIAGEAAGCVVVNHIDPDNAEIKRLYVAPAGRRAGTGRALMLAAIDYARQRGYRRLLLDTERERLEPAYKLYLALGFTECAPHIPPARPEYENPTYMELML